MEKADLSHHISRRFNEDLAELLNRVLAMGGLVEQQVQLGMKALVKGDSDLGQKVAHEDHKVNRMEVGIDEACSRILARRQPAAGDLRLVVGTIKAITDLERIGDEAQKIGFLAARLAGAERPADKYAELKALGRQVTQMIHDTLDAFARFDAPGALKVARMDELIDSRYEAIREACIEAMSRDPMTIRRVLDVMWAARALERIGDHARNLCEYVVYMVHGKDVRHTKLVAAQIAVHGAAPTAANTESESGPDQT